MARSTIAFLKNDGTVQQICCDEGGSLEENGWILWKHYSNPTRVEQLMRIGNLASLGTELLPSSCSVSSCKTFASLQEFEAHGRLEEGYDYLYREKTRRWSFILGKYLTGGLVLEPLERALRNWPNLDSAQQHELQLLHEARKRQRELNVLKKACSDSAAAPSPTKPRL